VPWKRFSELLASGQRAYCPCCGARFQGNMGVLMENRSDDNWFWLRATHDGDLNDIRWMFLEGDTDPEAISQELLQKFKEARPYVGRNMFRHMLLCERHPRAPVDHTHGALRVLQRDYIMSLPVWEVSVLVAFAKRRFLSHCDAIERTMREASPRMRKPASTA
jgi:hypothetical protein